MFQMPSAVEGGIFTVSDPSLPPACSAAADTILASDDKRGRSISFSGKFVFFVWTGYVVCQMTRKFRTGDS